MATPIASHPLFGWLPLAGPEAPASHCASACCYRCPEDVGVIAVVVAELEFCDVDRQVLARDVMEHADDAALNQGPEALDCIGVDGADDVLAFGVLNDGGWELIPRPVVASPCVRNEQANLGGHRLADEAGQGVRADVVHHARHEVAFALNGACHWRLAGTHAAPTGATALVLVPVLGLPPDERLVSFNKAYELSELGINHRGTDAVRHRQGCLVRSEAHHALDLQTADAFLASQHHVDDAEPLAQRLVGVLEDGVHQHREPISAALSAIRAFPMEWPVGQSVNPIRTAARAAYAVRPAAIGEIRFASVIGGEEFFPLRHCQLLGEARITHDERPR